jgi:predicted HAD superfamily Cof-like phosphohydrolase
MESTYDPQANQTEMMTLFGQMVRKYPQVPSPEECLLRGRLNVEEGAVELLKALGLRLTHRGQNIDLDELEVVQDDDLAPNLTLIADAAADTLVVTYGLLNCCGIDAQRIYAEVHRSNMSKVWRDGTIHKRADGKVLKPSTYSPADLKTVLDAQRDEYWEGRMAEADALEEALAFDSEDPAA